MLASVFARPLPPLVAIAARESSATPVRTRALLLLLLLLCVSSALPLDESPALLLLADISALLLVGDSLALMLLLLGNALLLSDASPALPCALGSVAEASLSTASEARLLGLSIAAALGPSRSAELLLVLGGLGSAEMLLLLPGVTLARPGGDPAGWLDAGGEGSVLEELGPKVLAKLAANLTPAGDAWNCRSAASSPSDAVIWSV